MPLVVAHDNKTEITGLTKDNAYHVVDLSTYVQTGCLGVLLQFVNNHATDFKNGGFKSSIAIAQRNIIIKNTCHQIILAELDTNYLLALKCEDSNVDIFIMAEFFEGTVLRHTDEWISLANPAGWTTHTVTPLGDDAYADIEAVLVCGVKTGGVQDFGVRALGSTEEPVALIADHRFAIPVKTNSNGQYQVYIPSAGCGPSTVEGKELGYIKKGYGFTAIFEPEDLTLSTNDDWEDFDLEGVIGDYSTHAVVRLILDGAAESRDTCGVKAQGSTNEADVLTGGVWAVYWPSIDDSKLAEYRYKGDKTVIFDVWGYVAEEAPPEPPVPPVPPSPVELDISDRFVVSLGPIMLETLNLSNVTGGESITAQLQNPQFGFGVVTSDNFYITSAISPLISGRNVVINGIDSDKDSDLVLMLFGY